jgi:signal transduction histidine kinase
MRERVSMLGGQIEVGPRDSGGFALRARLPLDGVA